MSHCHLNDLPPISLQGTTKLQSIDLGSNYLINVSHSFFTLTDLKYLNLEENEILTLEERTFRDLSNLKTLLLNGNRIHKVNKNVFQKNTRITKLTFHNNNISVLEKEMLKPLVNLVQLDMDSNPFKCDCKLQTVYIWSLAQNVTSKAECRHPNGSHIPWAYVGSLTCVGDTPVTEYINKYRIPYQTPISNLQNDALHISSSNMYILIVICIIVFILFAVCFAYIRRRYRGSCTPNSYDVDAARKAGSTYTNFQMGEVTSVVMNSKTLGLSGSTSLQSTLSSRYSRSPVATAERRPKKLTI
ncbi:hypothetical protein L9F63_021708 [Diploptera punctata]|uniref:Uncharacterized protein n=1 Tax=Diploptera punctata TaxID=6984 RepID=A0AAD8EBM9_DIPPU|nr:hypothetical protein L9F63_021708 [Diploptera punctata]